MEEAVLHLGNTMGAFGKTIDCYAAIGMIVFRHGVWRKISRRIKETTQISAFPIEMDPVAGILMEYTIRKNRKHIGFPEYNSVVRCICFFHKGQKGLLIFPLLKRV